MKTMTDKERVIIPELINVVVQLPMECQQKLLYMGQGILLARENGNDRRADHTRP